MAVSPEEHARVVAELVETKAELVETKAELVEAKAGLGDAKARIEHLEAQQATLQAAMEKLRAELSKNSSNSNLPPSSDGPGAASRGMRRSKKPKSEGTSTMKETSDLVGVEEGRRHLHAAPASGT